MDYKKIVRSVLSNRNLSLPQKINNIKLRVESGDYKNSLSHPSIANFLFKLPLFKSIEDIQIKEPFQFTGDFKKEFRWLAYIVENYLSEINSFFQLKNEFEKILITGDLENAKSKILYIESLFGVSLWSIDCRILLTDLYDGSEANWNALSKYLNIIKNSIYEFNISSSSKRAESNLSYESFLKQFQNDIDNIQASGFVKDYFVFKNFSYANYEYEFKDLSSVLYVSNIFSVIDQYLILLDSIIYNISRNAEYDKLFLSFIKNAKCLVPNDPRLTAIFNIVNHKDDSGNPSANSEYITCINSYYMGDFEKSLETSRCLLLSDPLEYELYQVYCKSLINLGLDFIPLELSGLANSILVDTFKLFNFRKDEESCVKRLLKISLQLMNFNIGKQIFALLSEIEGQLDWNYYTGILSTSFINPKNSKFVNFHQNVESNLLKFASQESFKFYNGIEFGTNEHTDFNSKSEIQTIFACAAQQFKIGNFERTIEILGRIENVIPNYYLEKKNSLIYFSYLHLGRLKEALTLFSSIYFDNNLIYRKIDYLSLFDEIKRLSDKSDFTSLIELSILFSLVVKEYDLFEVYDDFILNFGVDDLRDLDINLMIEKFGKLKTIHFLEKVATIDTLKYNTDYASISEVEEDRIHILEQLTVANPINKQLYEKERDEIYRASSVRKVLKEVDEGRLYIDVNSLKDLQINKFQDDFKRYKEIELSSTNQTLIGFNPFNTKNWDKALVEKNETIDLYNSADYLAFKNIYLESRDNFLFSKEYGLDSCLSTRIRHGALKNHIRSVFEKLDLVSSKSKDTYINNPVWHRQLSHNPEINNLVQERLKLFSKQIDDYTIYIRDSLIQIQTEKQPEKKEGLFAYFTNDELLFRFYSEHKPFLISVDKAIEIILTNLVNYTLIHLQNDINTRFSNEISNYFQTLIESTITDLRKLELPNECQLIANLTKSSTDINQELDYLSEWFYLNTTNSSSILSIHTLLDASFHLTNRINPLFNLVPNVQLEEDFGGYSSLIFVFNILLNNVIAHSNLHPRDIVLDVIAKKSDDDKYMQITFSNNVNSKVNYALNIEKLEKVKQNWNNHDNIERSNKEGESGFDKIKRILLYEALAKTDLFDFSFENGKFSITLFFPFKKAISDASIIDN